MNNEKRESLEFNKTYRVSVRLFAKKAVGCHRSWPCFLNINVFAIEYIFAVVKCSLVPRPSTAKRFHFSDTVGFGYDITSLVNHSLIHHFTLLTSSC